jgi:hypothetical protein
MNIAVVMPDLAHAAQPRLARAARGAHEDERLLEELQVEDERERHREIDHRLQQRQADVAELLPAQAPSIARRLVELAVDRLQARQYSSVFQPT